MENNDDSAKSDSSNCEVKFPPGLSNIPGYSMSEQHQQQQPQQQQQHQQNHQPQNQNQLMLPPQSDGEQPKSEIDSLLPGHRRKIIRRAANRRSAQQSRARKKVFFSFILN
jgi:transcription initiation factor TFIID subunit TAF12